MFCTGLFCNKQFEERIWIFKKKEIVEKGRKKEKRERNKGGREKGEEEKEVWKLVI